MITPPKKLIQIFRNYEQTHDISIYRCYDWNVWPLLRLWIGFEHVSSQRRITNRWPVCFLKKFRYMWRLFRVLQAVKYFFVKSKFPPVNSRSLCKDSHSENQIVILTFSSRRQKMGECFYEIFSDPLVEALECLEKSPLVWERGDELWPQCRPSVYITRALNCELAHCPNLPDIPQPKWFDDFCELAEEITHRKIYWPEIESFIKKQQNRSLVLERWLRALAPKILICLTWDDAVSMAATIAAKRLNILTSELQHGLQGKEHMAYSGWTFVPNNGYEIIPDLFLTWSRYTANELMNNNPSFKAQSKAVAVGNLWLNKWLIDLGFNAVDSSNYLMEKLTKSTKVILVSLQYGSEFEKPFIDAICHAPDDWLWLVRHHPRSTQKTKSKLARILDQKARGRFETKFATELPLYSLLGLVSAHLTKNSTTAFESLSFGVPTVALVSDSSNLFDDYVSMGVMFYAKDSTDIIASVSKCSKVSKELCKKVSCRLFDKPSNSREGLKRLLDIAGIVRKA